MANIMDKNTKHLIGKWGKRIGLVEKARGEALSYEKRACLANALENTNQRILAMEATNPGSIGQYKRYALDIVTSVVPNLIAFDCYAVQAMDNRIGMLNYIDYSYSKGKGTTKDGDVFASSINMGKSDPYYTTDTVKDEVVGQASSATYTTTLNWTPIILNSFMVEVGSVIGVADGTGTITGTGITGSITADGSLSITLTSAPASATDVVVNYRFNNEDVRSDGPVGAGFTNVPEIELKINSVPIEAKARTLRSFWSFDAQYELQKEYGQDIETLLATQSTGEIAHKYFVA